MRVRQITGPDVAVMKAMFVKKEELEFVQLSNITSHKWHVDWDLFWFGCFLTFQLIIAYRLKWDMFNNIGNN